MFHGTNEKFRWLARYYEVSSKEKVRIYTFKMHRCNKTQHRTRILQLILPYRRLSSYFNRFEDTHSAVCPILRGIYSVVQLLFIFEVFNKCVVFIQWNMQRDESVNVPPPPPLPSPFHPADEWLFPLLHARIAKISEHSVVNPPAKVTGIFECKPFRRHCEESVFLFSRQKRFSDIRPVMHPDTFLHCYQAWAVPSSRNVSNGCANNTPSAHHSPACRPTS